MEQEDKFAREMGLRIREARREKGLTIEQLAERADMSPQYLSEVERGKKIMGSMRLRNVSLVLAKSTDYFIHGVGGADPRRANILEELVALPPLDQERAVELLEDVLRIVRGAERRRTKRGE